MSETAPRRGPRVKRWLAVGGFVAVAVMIVVVLGVVALAVQQAGDGADPDVAFSPTENILGALAADVVWDVDADDLVRLVEPATREAVAVMWLRADDALLRAAAGDVSGLGVWFVDGALAAAQGRFTQGHLVDVAPASGHRLRVDFYSLDGQVMVLSVDTIRLRRGPDRGEAADVVEVVERLEALVVLSDGNWRVRHLERLTPELGAIDDLIGS